jgi:hypothetical protein
MQPPPRRHYSANVARHVIDSATSACDADSVASLADSEAVHRPGHGTAASTEPGTHVPGTPMRGAASGPLLPHHDQQPQHQHEVDQQPAVLGAGAAPETDDDEDASSLAAAGPAHSLAQLLAASTALTDDSAHQMGPCSDHPWLSHRWRELVERTSTRLLAFTVQRGAAWLAAWLLQVLTSVGVQPADVLEVRAWPGLCGAGWLPDTCCCGCMSTLWR